MGAAEEVNWGGDPFLLHGLRVAGGDRDVSELIDAQRAAFAVHPSDAMLWGETTCRLVDEILVTPGLESLEGVEGNPEPAEALVDLVRHESGMYYKYLSNVAIHHANRISSEAVDGDTTQARCRAAMAASMSRVSAGLLLASARTEMQIQPALGALDVREAVAHHAFSKVREVTDGLGDASLWLPSVIIKDGRQRAIHSDNEGGDQVYTPRPAYDGVPDQIMTHSASIRGKIDASVTGVRQSMEPILLDARRQEGRAEATLPENKTYLKNPISSVREGLGMLAGGAHYLSTVFMSVDGEDTSWRQFVA